MVSTALHRLLSYAAPSPAPTVAASRNDIQLDKVFPLERRHFAALTEAKYASQHLIKDRKAVGISKGSYLRVHYKNTRETAAALTGLSLAKAVKFLEDVQTHTQCVPFRRHNGSVGRTAQAKVHGVVQGRWPVKSAKFLLALVKNAQANAEVNGLDKDELFVKNIVVQQAPKMRINPFQSSPTHLEVILAPYGAEVPAAEEAPVEAIEACWRSW
ncbi:60S ribosomal protein L17B [Rhodotorula toruloides]